MTATLFEYIKINSSRITGIIKSIETRYTYSSGKMNDDITHTRLMSPAVEWYMYASKVIKKRAVHKIYSFVMVDLS